jgi:hypothetical protein
VVAGTLSENSPTAVVGEAESGFHLGNPGLTSKLQAHAVCSSMKKGRFVINRKSLASMLVVIAVATPTFANYTLSTLAYFSPSTGVDPYAGLTFDGSTLYGTTTDAGPYPSTGYTYGGTVFSLPTSGGTPTVLAAFGRGTPDYNNGYTGDRPDSSLLIIPASPTPVLVGTTYYGGPTGYGTEFQASTNRNYNFDSNVNEYLPDTNQQFGINGVGTPSGGVTLVGNQVFGVSSTGGYGQTAIYGTNNFGIDILGSPSAGQTGLAGIIST